MRRASAFCGRSRGRRCARLFSPRTITFRASWGSSIACASFGDPLADGGFSFPGPERLAALSPEDLAPLRCGFRARYVIDAAQKVAGGLDLEALRTARFPRRARRCSRSAARRPEGRGVRPAVRPAPSGRVSARRVDAPRDGLPLPRLRAGDLRPLCGDRPAVYFPLQPPSSRAVLRRTAACPGVCRRSAPRRREKRDLVKITAGFAQKSVNCRKSSRSGERSQKFLEIVLFYPGNLQYNKGKPNHRIGA